MQAIWSTQVNIRYRNAGTFSAAAVSLIKYARISNKEKQMIASGNLENLIGGIKL